MSEIQTERLVLRNVQFADLNIYRNIRVRLAGAESFTPPPRPAANDQAWWDTNIASGNSVMWTVLADDNIVASICAFSFDRETKGSAEVGVEVFRPEDYGKGYATESLIPFFEFLYSSKERKLLIAQILPENQKSIKLFERLGFEDQGLIKDPLDENLIFKKMTKTYSI